MFAKRLVKQNEINPKIESKKKLYQTSGDKGKKDENR